MLAHTACHAAQDRDREDSRHALALVSAHDGELGLVLRMCTDPDSYAADDRERHAPLPMR